MLQSINPKVDGLDLMEVRNREISGGSRADACVTPVVPGAGTKPVTLAGVMALVTPVAQASTTAPGPSGRAGLGVETLAPEYSNWAAQVVETKNVCSHPLLENKRKTSHSQPVELLKSKSTKLYLSKKSVHYFKCAGRGMSHQTP